MKIRGYQLKFIRTNPYLTIGMLVSITGKIPTTRPRPSNSKPNEGHMELGRIMGIKEDNRLGTIYVVMEYGTGKMHKYVEDKLLAIAPVLVSEDKFTNDCVVYLIPSGEMLIGRRKHGTHIDYISFDDGRIYHKNDAKRIVARSHEIGHVLNYGPPHDRNATWKRVLESDGEEEGILLYLEELHRDVLPRLFDNGGVVRVLVGEDDNPIFHEGKIVIDAYNLYSVL